MAQQQSGYGGPYQSQQSTAGGFYGDFMSDPTAQVTLQVGQTALKHGQEYMEQNVRIFPYV